MPKPVLFSSLYGELTRNVQARFDAASRLNKEIFDKVIYRQFMDWDTPTIGLDFEELIGKYNITVAAATIGEHSKEPIIGSEGLDTVKERVLNHAITRPMSMQDYRKILQLLDSKSISDEQKKKELIKLMWGDVTWVVNGVEAKLDIIFLSALSNCGVFTFDENNNPEGGVRGEINFNQPTTNIARLRPNGLMPTWRPWIVWRTSRQFSTSQRTVPTSVKSFALRLVSRTCVAQRR